MSSWDRPNAEAGETLTIQAWFFGEVAASPAIMGASLLDALTAGLGRKDRAGRRGEVTITGLTDLVSGVHREVEQGSQFQLHKPGVREVSIKFPLDSGNRSTKQVLVFKTPVRLVREGKVCAQPDFRTLIATILRRYTTLVRCHEGAALELDAKAILERAALIPHRGKWRRWRMERWSARQKSSMRMDGVLGEMCVDDGGAFHEILKIGSLLGVGKNTTFGMGVYEMRGDDHEG